MTEFKGYILSKSPEAPKLAHGISDQEPSVISAQGWAVNYGVMKAHLPHAAGPDDHLLPVTVYENGDVELMNSSGAGAKRFTSREIYALNDMEFPYPAASFPAGDYDMRLTGFITDMEEFCENFMDDGDRLSVGANFTKALFTPCSKNLPSEVTGAQFRSLGTEIDMTLNVSISDPDLFLMIACHGGRNSGRDHDYVPENMGDAIFEAYFGASDTPTPVDCGFEIRDWTGDPVILTNSPRNEELAP